MKIICLTSPYIEAVFKDILEAKQPESVNNGYTAVICDIDLHPEPPPEAITISARKLAHFKKPVRIADLLQAVSTQAEIIRKNQPIKIFGIINYSESRNRLSSPKPIDAAQLTEKEGELLKFLLTNPEGANKSRILEQVWGLTHNVETSTLETHTAWLRKKLEDTSEGMVTIECLEGKYRLIRKN